MTAMSPGYNSGPMPPIGVIASSPHSQRGQMPASSPAPPSEMLAQQAEPGLDTTKDSALDVEPLEQATTKPQMDNENDPERRPSQSL